VSVFGGFDGGTYFSLKTILEMPQKGKIRIFAICLAVVRKFTYNRAKFRHPLEGYAMKTSLFHQKKILHLGAVILAVGLLAVVATAQAVVVSPIQSSADPQKLPIAGLVNLAGSDTNSAAFLLALPSINATLKNTLPEYKALSATAMASMALDPASLRLAVDSSVRVYFVSEGASYRNTLGLNVLPSGSAIPTATTPSITSAAELVFPDASSNDPTTYYPSGNSVRTATAPLDAGDFVNLNTLRAGTLLDFFLISNGAGGGSTTFTDETARNSDNFQHIVSFRSGNYIILSFEDANGGGDKDFNDMVVAIEITPNASAPEPGVLAALTVFCGAIGARRCRRAIKSLLN